MAGPAGPVCPQHVGELSADAWKGVSLYRGHPVEPATADCSGEYAGRTAEAEIPWQAHRGGHGAEVPDRGLRRPHRCQAERDHPEEPGPDDRSAAGTPHYTVHSLPPWRFRNCWMLWQRSRGTTGCSICSPCAPAAAGGSCAPSSGRISSSAEAVCS